MVRRSGESDDEGTEKSRWFLTPVAGQQVAPVPADENVISVEMALIYSSQLQHLFSLAQAQPSYSSLVSCFGNCRIRYQNHCTDGLHCGFAFIAIMAIRGCC